MSEVTDLEAAFTALLDRGLTQADVLAVLSRRDADKMGEETFGELREYADGTYGSRDVEVDSEPLFSPADHGTWVSAWVWVPHTS